MHAHLSIYASEMLLFHILTLTHRVDTHSQQSHPALPLLYAGRFAYATGAGDR